ncbi:serine/threonine-protein kinase [Nonomuraea indica]|uniref:non-specific serine/threonine protein kinase n=1 Tax=Nonomuraea indica TaxID=1581193 RepID=A0ABW8A7N6_9ACTN
MERQVGNRYRLVEPIGEGGMGVVWRAYDELLDRTVAIKEVRYTGVADDERAQLNRRTIREARAAGRLDHPSVVVIHDVVEEGGRPWIVMQLVRSRSLAQVVREHGPLPVGRVAAIGGQVLDALRAAHATGVLHRDVKPENVLLADDGRVVLTDFGIASLEAEAGLTATGGLVGTPAYMPPERLHGDPARPESDLWALGATLYAAVEGAPPYKRDSWAATVAAVLRDDPEPPRRAGPLTPVIMGLLLRDPAARMPAGEAARLLWAAAGHAPAGHAPAAGRVTWPPVGAAPGDPARPAPFRPGPGPGDHGPGDPDRGPAGQGRAAHPVVDATLHAGADPTSPAQRRGGRRWPRGVVPAAAALVAAAVLGTGAVLLADRPDSPGSGPAAADRTGTDRAGTATPVGSPVTPATPDATGRATTAATPRNTPSGARRVVPPPGWRSYTSPAGRFSVAIPAGWRAVPSATRASVTVRAPGSPSRLIIEWTVADRPWTDPARHWADLEKEILAKGEFSGYRRLSIEPTTYLGRPAADWEFTRVADGTVIHVVNRGFRTASGRPYAIYWETTEARWPRERRYFETFTKTFTPR